MFDNYPAVILKNQPDSGKKMGCSCEDIARFLGIKISAVNRFAVSDELPEVEKYV